MNCELAHERIVMAAYGELPDDAAHELERHLTACLGCAQEREQLRALKLLADAYPAAEPEANLVARSRMRLEEALDALPPKRWFERWAQLARNSFLNLRSAPLAAGVLLAVSGAGGVWGGYHLALRKAAVPAAVAVQGQAANPVPGTDAESMEVANVSSIVRQPNSEEVEVRYNRVVPQRMRGSLDDPAIRQLLMLASETAVSTDVRDDSVGLLAAECRAGHSCRPNGIRDALLVALRYDRNAGVRAKALEGLEPYVAEDRRVRDAVLETLLSDSDPRIRSAAIGMLAPVEGDTSVRQALSTAATTDRSPQIRLVSRQVLSRAPVIQ